MAVYLSPGVFPREIDLSVIPTAVGPLRPAFVGTAQKGPMNEPTLVTNATQAINIFGEPFSDSYLMYAVLSYMEEGNSAYIMRAGVEYDSNQATVLQDIAIDVAGNREKGWGRIPVFSGIDYGQIDLRLIDSDNSIVFHAASIVDISYNDATDAGTFGVTSATIGTSGTYTGAIDDTFVMIITGSPNISDDAKVAGATFEIIRNSDGVVVANGTLSEGGAPDGDSTYISVGDGVSVRVEVTTGVLQVNDTFTWRVIPDNRAFKIAVDGTDGSSYTMPAATYTTVAAFVSAANALLSGENWSMVSDTRTDAVVIPQIRSSTAGERVQIVAGEAWAIELGQQLWAWDIPRSYLLGQFSGPFDISTQNNRVVIDLVGSQSASSIAPTSASAALSGLSTATVEFNVPIGNDQSVATIAAAIDVAGVVAGETLFDSFSLSVPGGETKVVIVATVGRQFDTLRMRADHSNIRTLRFSEELDIDFPYKKSYRGFSDNTLILPASGESTASTPLSCETDSTSATCTSETAYFQNIVGFFVAPSPGTWLGDVDGVNAYEATLDSYTEGVGETAGRYALTITDKAGVAAETISDVTFDQRDDRYIGNVLNPGTKYGGTNGNAFVHWEQRPAFLNNNVNVLTGGNAYTVRLPSQFTNKAFRGMANGIPTDPAYSSELDAVVIGNPAINSGIYAFQNPESIDINLLLIPGFSSGAVIGTALQMCESRGDTLFIVDPPFGLRPQQAVDWHNGMLLSDVSAAINSSYGALYWGWVKIFDQFAADEIWVPPSGHVASVFSRTAREREQWFAPAGLQRGHLLTALDVEYSPTQGERDLLYGSGNAVNPIVKFPQDGITVWGQRTLQRSFSALDRVNVRMLLIHLKKNLVRSLRNFVFEPNDSALWAQVRSTVNPFLADVQARRGLQAFKVVCDETNNTPERIDRNELWVSVFLKPTRAVEFIVLNLVVLRTGASFSAEEVLAAGGVVTTEGRLR
jgi:hypothetical protein